MDEPTADPTPTTARPDGPGTTQDSGDAVFYAALFGAFVGIIAAGVFGLMIGNPALKEIDDPSSSSARSQSQQSSSEWPARWRGAPSSER